MLLVDEELAVLEAYFADIADDFRNGAIDAHRLAAAIYDSEVARGGDNRRQHRQADLEARDELPVKRVHEDVRAGVDLGDARVRAGDVPRTESAGGDDVCRETIPIEGIGRGDQDVV